MCDGPRQTELALVAQVQARLTDGLPQHPVVVVVPSARHRLQVLRRLAEAGPLLGVEVRTLFGFACSVIGLRGGQLPGEVVLPVLVRRLLHQHPVLGEALGDLDGVAHTVVRPVRELLDAGFEAVHLEAARDALPPHPARARWQGVLEVAAGARTLLDDAGLLRRAEVLTQAAAQLRISPLKGSFIITGFANATGAALTLLEGLTQHDDCCVLFDLPRDPISRDRVGQRYTQTVRERLGPTTDHPGNPDPNPLLALPAVEVRDVVGEVWSAIETGVRPDEIALVWRGEGQDHPIRAALEEVGIPVGSQIPQDEQLMPVVRVLTDGPKALMQRWCGVRGCSWRVVLGLKGLGIRRLQDVHVLDAQGLQEAEQWPLPTLGADPETGEGDSVAMAELLEEVTLMGRFLAVWQQPPEATNWLAEALDALGLDELATRAQDRFALMVPFAPTREEWVDALTRHGVDPEPLQATSGVQILSAEAARGSTFRRLILMNAERGRFPKIQVDDALLPDLARRSLLPVIPALPTIEMRADGERHLFAQLLGAADEVVIAWREYDASGRPCGISPFVAQLRQHRLLREGDPPAPPPQPVEAHVQAAGLWGSRADYGRLLPIALQQRSFGIDPRALAQARVALLDRLDPDLSTPEGRRWSKTLGPSFGQVGARRGDHWHSEPAVTTLEHLGKCGWRTLLTRILQVQRSMADDDVLPTLHPVWIGRVVHDVLERIARQTPALWPKAALVEAWARHATLNVLRDEGVLDGTSVQLVTLRALAYLDVAHRMDFITMPEVVGIESRGSLALEDANGLIRSVPFRVDRVDRRDPKRVFVDYKTGRPLSLAASPQRRLQHLLAAVARGEHLQAAVYAAHTQRAVGRILYLRPEPEPPDRVLEVDGDDVGLRQTMGHAIRTLWQAWDHGLFFPRFIDGPREPIQCSSCPVAEACNRGDSSARLRLQRWLSHPPEGPGDQLLRQVIGLGRDG